MSELRSLCSIALCALWLATVGLGCAAVDGPKVAEAPLAPKTDPPRLHLELIEKMLESGKAHAALAHLDALPPGESAVPAARLLRGEALRRTNQLDAAASVYEPLLTSEAAAPAWRGLALIKAEQGDLETAIAWLRRARDLQPTAARIRNDLGYALLLRGELGDAEYELVTALELEGSRRAARNLVLLYLLQNQDESAQRLADRHQIDAAALARLRQRAERMRAHLAQRSD